MRRWLLLSMLSWLIGLGLGPRMGWAQTDVQTPGSELQQLKMLIEGLELSPLREDQAVEELGVYDSYDEAQQLEAEVVQMYREIRAAELSLIQRQTLDRSLESTLTPLSERAEVDAALLTESAKDADAVKAYQSELSLVLRETDAIVANARDLLESLLPKPSPVPEVNIEPTVEAIEEAVEELSQAESATPMEASELSSETMQASEPAQQLQAQQAELQQQVEQNLEEVELNLEEALKEIEAAQKIVEAQVEENESLVEQLEKELAETETKEAKKEETLEQALAERAVLKTVNEAVEQAEELVEAVVEELQTAAEVPEEQLEQVEAAMEVMRAALAATMNADAAVTEMEQPATQKHTEAAVQEVQAAQKAMQAAAEGMAALEAMAEMLAILEAGETPGGIAIAQQQVLGVLSHATSGRWIDLTGPMRGIELNAKAIEVPPEERPELWKDRKAMDVLPSSRKVVLDSKRGADWFFVGDWYVLSRYDNANRSNRQKVYPPESILDLNARYASEDGQAMEWQYASFTPPRIRPYGGEEWKIYYFYTEMYFETETEAWLAIGSDDRSDLWINDLPVWHSSNEHKNWNPYEGFRKVYFKPGRNKVLLRLENGHQGLGFSLYFKLD